MRRGEMDLSHIIQYLEYIQNSNEPVIFFSKTTIIFILLFLLLRHLFVGGLYRQCSKIDREIHKAVRKEYFHFCWIGWILFLIGLSLFHLLIFRNAMLVQYLRFDLWLCVIIFFFLSGIYFLLYFFTRGVLIVFKQRIDIEKN